MGHAASSSRHVGARASSPQAVGLPVKAAASQRLSRARSTCAMRSRSRAVAAGRNCSPAPRGPRRRSLRSPSSCLIQANGRSIRRLRRRDAWHAGRGRERLGPGLQRQAALGLARGRLGGERRPAHGRAPGLGSMPGAWSASPDQARRGVRPHDLPADRSGPTLPPAPSKALRHEKNHPDGGRSFLCFTLIEECARRRPWWSSGLPSHVPGAWRPPFHSRCAGATNAHLSTC